MNERVLDISWGTIVKLSIAALAIYVIFLTRDLLIWILFGIILSIIFDPAIDFLQKRRIPRVLAAMVVYFGIFAVIGFAIFKTAPFFLEEVKRFSQFLPQYLRTIAPILENLGIVSFENINVTGEFEA